MSFGDKAVLLRNWQDFVYVAIPNPKHLETLNKYLEQGGSGDLPDSYIRVSEKEKSGIFYFKGLANLPSNLNGSRLKLLENFSRNGVKFEKTSLVSKVKIGEEEFDLNFDAVKYPWYLGKIVEKNLEDYFKNYSIA